MNSSISQRLFQAGTMNKSNRWCDKNDLMITARFDGQIVISRIDADFDATATGSAIYEHYRHEVIRAEVEAMDWPEVIGE